MGRQAKFQIVLTNQKRIGYSLKLRGDIYRVQFADPDAPGKYREVSTGSRTIGDAHTVVAQIIQDAYCTRLPVDPKRVTWQKVGEELAAATDLRPRSLEVYLSIIKVLQAHIDTVGPYEVTPESAKLFRRVYSKSGFKRSNQSDAKVYPRSAKTIENALRRLSGLWSHLKKLGYAIDNPWADIPRPTVPKKLPVIPSDEDVEKFFTWLEATFPQWALPRLFVEVKAISGCRLNDLCQIRSDQLNGKTATLTIRPEDDKTHRERVIPLPLDLAKQLDAIKGPTYLWETYNRDAKKYRHGSKSRDEFTPEYFYNAMRGIFRAYAKAGGKLRSHGLRKRAITLTALATQSVDATAQAIGIDPLTARKYYLDASKAFEGTELLKKMADVLRPKTTAPQSSEPEDPSR